MTIRTRHQVQGGSATARRSHHRFHPRINLPVLPRTPTRRFGGPVARWEGWVVDRLSQFIGKGRQGVRENPVDRAHCHHADRGSTKRIGRFARFQLPRVRWFLPRVGQFFPCVVFRGVAPSSSFFFEISEEREEKRVDRRRARRSTGSNSRENLYPRVQLCGHGFSVAQKMSNSQCRRGLAAYRGCDPRVHGSNAPGYPASDQAGGGRG